MKQVVYDHPDEMIAWAEAKIGHDCRFRDDARAIGLRNENGYLGVVVFDAFTTTGCWISVASDGTGKWLTREFILRVFAYPFIQCGHPRLNAFVSAGNQTSAAFCRSFGFTEEGRMREAGFNREDLIVFGMLRGECRWLPERFSGKLGRALL